MSKTNKKSNKIKKNNYKATIKNYQVEDNKFDDIIEKIKGAYPTLTLSSEQKKRILSKIPKYYYRTIKYEVHGAHLCISNGWRRTMIDEIEYPRLSIRMDDIKTDDPYNARLTDYIQTRIYLIPTSYVEQTDEYKKVKLEINIKNDTQKNIIVKSSDIQVIDGDCPIEWSPNIDLITLRPGFYLKIPISIEWGKNNIHHTFSCFARTTAYPLMVHEYKNADLPSSLTVHPMDHVHAVEVLSFTKPKDAILLGWNTLLATITRAINALELVDDVPYQSDELKVTLAEGNRIRYEFFNETITLTEIIAWYAYQLDTSIKLIFAGDDHPEDKSSLIYINHPDHIQLLLNGAKEASKIIRSIIQQFKEYH